MTKLNTGLSGCSLELINDRVLRKYSPTTDYNSRLLSQADKQVVFGNRIYKNIDAPKVYDIQKNYFDMEYVAGKSFEDFFSIASVNDVEFVVSTLFDYFDALIFTARNIDATKQILEKLDNLKEKSSYPKYIEFLRKYVEDRRIIVPHTFCHGDLTLANIIFHKNRLFFIDFLDCYVDTFLSDLVKLKQDLHHLQKQSKRTPQNFYQQYTPCQNNSLVCYIPLVHLYFYKCDYQTPLVYLLETTILNYNLL